MSNYIILITFSFAETAYFFAYIGIASALVFANLVASYGTAKSAVGISSLAVIEPGKIFQGLIPIIMAGILGIYGIIISSLLSQDCKSAASGNGNGFAILGAGLCCGLSALASGLAIGVAGDADVRECELMVLLLVIGMLILSLRLLTLLNAMRHITVTVTDIGLMCCCE